MFQFHGGFRAMPNRAVLVPLVAIILLVYSIFSGGAIPTWKSIDRTAGIVGFLLLAWDYYLWRIPWVYPKFAPQPNLRGTWRASATIFYLPQPIPNPPLKIGSKQIEVKFESLEGYVIIHQTGSGFKLTALWDEDMYTSRMKHLAPVTGNDGRGVFVGQYENRQGTIIGIVGTIIHFPDDPIDAKLYYTTIEPVPQRGIVVLTSRVRQFCETRDEARKLPLDSKRKLVQKIKFLFWPW
jgi:hypothetical protein